MSNTLSINTYGGDTMKELIYLDTEYVHSFIAQTEDGLPVTTDLERTEELQESNEKETSSGTESKLEGKFKLGELEIPLIFKSPTGELIANIKPTNNARDAVSLTQLESGKEIISKQLHDNALEKFEDYLDKNGRLHSNISIAGEGDFIKIISNFSIIDFKYLKEIFSPEKILNFIFFDFDTQIENAKQQMAKMEGKQKTAIRMHIEKQERETEKLKKEQQQTFEFLNEALDYLVDVLPSNAFLLAKGMIVPLKPDFLRESSKDLTFKYGASEPNAKISIVGKVTRIIEDVSLPDFQGQYDFLKVGEIVNYLLNSIGVLSKGDYLISPIAIYFE